WIAYPATRTARSGLVGSANIEAGSPPANLGLRRNRFCRVMPAIDLREGAVPLAERSSGISYPILRFLICVDDAVESDLATRDLRCISGPASIRTNRGDFVGLL